MDNAIKILVIDDSEDDRLLYKRCLRKNADTAYTITEADNGEDGIRHVADDEPACVLLDYSLPGRNGLEILKRIRAKHPFVAVVMLTGQGNEAVAVTAMQEGAQNYISKSTINNETLTRVIQVAIEHCAMERRIHEQRTSLEIFTRALAHDLKEPVRTIRSFLDLLAAHEELSERGKGYFNFIQNAAERMNTLIDTVYFYTRLDGGGHEVTRETCDVNKAMEDAKENLSELIRERHAIITYGNLPMVYANHMQVIQVLQNLICNAIRHCETTPHIHVHAGEGDEFWLFRIQDNGPGIAQEQAYKVFEPFKKLARHKEQGLGLGLAICKKIIESHGGKIWYESNGEAGATFLFTLPKNLQEAEKKPLSEKANVLANTNVNKSLASILLVEDSEADVELTRIMLIEEAHLRCNLLVARDGVEALSRLRDQVQDANPIDLILLDINMPGMDGFELLEHMRKDESLKEIPVVICSTSTYDKDMEKAKSLGVIGYINKPADLSKLKSIIVKTDHLRLQQEGENCMLTRAA